MPFDGTEQKFEKPGITLPALVSWLETQEPDTQYNWWSVTGNCLIGRYATATQQDFHDLHGQAHAQGWLGRIACSISGPSTYGHALKRARKFLGVKPARRWFQFWRTAATA